MASSSDFVHHYKGRSLSVTSKDIIRYQTGSDFGQSYPGPFPPARIVVRIFESMDGQNPTEDALHQLISCYEDDQDFQQHWQIDHMLRESYDPVFTDMEIELSTVEHLWKCGMVLSKDVHARYARLLHIENHMLNRVQFSLVQKSYIDRTYQFYIDKEEANAIMDDLHTDLRTMLDIVDVWPSNDATLFAKKLRKSLTTVDR